MSLLAICASGVYAPGAYAGHDVPGASVLPDHRGWEMVSPDEKNGGGVAFPDQSPPGTLQAASHEASIAYTSAASFADPQGAAPYSNYIASRNSSGWSTVNITPAQLAGAYESAAYLAFSKDLGRALLKNPSRCADGEPCPAGYRLVELESGAQTPSPTNPGELAGASDDLGRIVFARDEDLFGWSPASEALVQLNHLPAESLGAISDDGARAFWQGKDGNLYLNHAGTNSQIDAAQGGGGEFETASSEARVAYFSKAGHLYRYQVGNLSATDLTPSGGVLRVLGSSVGGTSVFYLTSRGIWRWQVGEDSMLALAGATDATSAGSGVSAAGERLYFTTAAKLTPTDDNLANDVYQWQARGSGDCERAGGCVDLISAGLAGTSYFAGASASGNDVYFLTSRSLVSSDTGAVDIYNARVGGGFPEPEPPSLCLGDACQSVPPQPEDPTLTTVLSGPGNPEITYHGATRACGPITRAARRMARASRLSLLRAKHLTRRARIGSTRSQKAKQLKQARRLNAQSTKLRKRSQKTLGAAKRCRLANRRARTQ